MDPEAGQSEAESVDEDQCCKHRPALRIPTTERRCHQETTFGQDFQRRVDVNQKAPSKDDLTTTAVEHGANLFARPKVVPVERFRPLSTLAGNRLIPVRDNSETSAAVGQRTRNTQTFGFEGYRNNRPISARRRQTLHGSSRRTEATKRISKDVGDRGIRSGQKRAFRVKTLDVSRLQELKNSGLDERALCLTLISQSSGLTELLNAERIESEAMPILLELLSRASRASVREYVLPLLSQVAESRFLAHHLTTTYLLEMTHRNGQSEQNLASETRNILDILNCILAALPRHFSKCLAVLIILDKILKPKNTSPAETPAEVREISALMNRAMDIGAKQAGMGDGKKGTKQNRDFRFPFEKVPPPDDFRQIPVCPTYDDIHTNRRPYIRVNKEKGGYENLGHFLDVQFRLLREDYIRPLREGIAEYLENVKAGKPEAKLKDLKLYRGVKIMFPTCLLDGVGYRIQLDITPLRNVQWKDSKRLMYGSLLCFSKDDFQTCLFATVIGRDTADLQQGFLDIAFIDYTDFEAISNQVFAMLETTAYFESYKYVLAGLQELDEETPFQGYIVSGQTGVKPPQYLLTDNPPVYDLSFCVEDGATESEKLKAKTVPILTTSRWPGTDTLCFDNSQLQAVKTALTKEFAIVQGPPGTGKTYVGLKIVQALLVNKSIWDKDKPILVVCYTNHALDQFLEGILDFGEYNLCRVGGRSNNERLKKYTLKKRQEDIRSAKDVRQEIVEGRRDCRSEMDALQRSVNEISIKLDFSKNGILHEKSLKEFMTDEQIRGFDLSMKDISQKKTVMPLWLHVCVDIYELYEGFAQSRLYALRPEHIERALSQICVYQRENFEKIEFLEYSHSELQKHLVDIAQFETSYDTNKPRQAEELAYDRRWDRYKELHLRFKERQKKSKLAAQRRIDQIKKLLQYLQDSDERNDRLGKQVKKMEKLKAQAEKTLFMLENMHGILRASALWDAMAQTEREGFGLVESPLDDFFFSRWLGYGDVIGILFKEMDSSTDDNPEESNLFADGNEIGAMQHPSTVEEEDEGLSLANAHKDRSDLARRLAAQEFSANPDQIVKLPFHQSQNHWQLDKPNRRKNRQRIKQVLGIGDKMNQEEAEKVIDIWKLNSTDRCRLYSYWLSLYRAQLQRSMSSMCEKYNEEADRLKKIREEEYYDILKSSSVVGMTTTGAAKNRAILNQLQSPILVVEEAAEVLESHVISCLTRGCKHLILIGDHKQLRPSPAVYELAIHYNLELSLFERMVKNGVRCDTLALQHRMRPEIADLMRLIYPTLRNHDSVQNFDSVQGVSCNVFFLNHFQEETAYDESKSHSNLHEAGFMSKLCRYLLLQGYEPFQITVLTMYSGQVFELKKAMTDNFFKGVKITSVDNYQGEENDIILLSLVRSNSAGSIGFLGVENRVCVALSRARKGLYVIGNFTMLKSQSSLWSDTVNKLECKESKNELTRLSFLMKALLYKCEQNCTKECPPCNKHCENRCVHSSCKKNCGEACIPCRKPCEWKCKHLACTRRCSEICDRPPCNKPCRKSLPCGHACVGLCGELCPPLCRLCDKEQLRQAFVGEKSNTKPWRFVYLKDCDHTLEVTGMDRWMAVPPKGRDDANPPAMRTSLKRCPKCKVVIRHSIRYGNAVKKMLFNLETQKKEIWGNFTSIAEKVKDLNQTVDRFSGQCDITSVRMDLRHENLSLPEVYTVEDKLALLTQASDVERLILMVRVHATEEIKEASQTLGQVKTRIKAWTVELGISDQELRESKIELTRLSFLMKALLYKCELKKHSGLSPEAATSLESVIQRLQSGELVNSNMEKELSKQMEDLEKLAPLSTLEMKTPKLRCLSEEKNPRLGINLKKAPLKSRVQSSAVPEGRATNNLPAKAPQYSCDDPLTYAYPYVPRRVPSEEELFSMTRNSKHTRAGGPAQELPE